MDATLVVIDSEPELARARALVDRLWDSDDPADIARLQAQARLSGEQCSVGSMPDPGTTSHLQTLQSPTHSLAQSPLQALAL